MDTVDLRGGTPTRKTEQGREMSKAVARRMLAQFERETLQARIAVRRRGYSRELVVIALLETGIGVVDPRRLATVIRWWRVRSLRIDRRGRIEFGLRDPDERLVLRLRGRHASLPARRRTVERFVSVASALRADAAASWPFGVDAAGIACLGDLTVDDLSSLILAIDGLVTEISEDVDTLIGATEEELERMRGLIERARTGDSTEPDVALSGDDLGTLSNVALNARTFLEVSSDVEDSWDYLVRILGESADRARFRQEFGDD